MFWSNINPNYNSTFLPFKSYLLQFLRPASHIYLYMGPWRSRWPYQFFRLVTFRASALFPCKPLIIRRLAFPQHSPRTLNTQVLSKTVRQPADNFEIFWWTFYFPQSYLFVDLFRFRRFSWHVKFLKVPENTSINWWDLGGVALKGLKGDGKMEGWPFKRAPKCQYYTE